MILPYVEESSLQRLYDFSSHWWEGRNLATATVRVPLYECPSVSDRIQVLSAVAKPPRPEISFSAAIAPTDYETIMGVQPSVNQAIYSSSATNRSAMFRNSAIRLSQIVDGTSHTIVIVECAARPLVYVDRVPRPDLPNDQGQGWIDSEGPFSLDGSNGDGTIQGQGPLLTPRAMNATNYNEPYSFHTGGGNFLFADGHVTFVDETVPLEVFAALCTRAAREQANLSNY